METYRVIETSKGKPAAVFNGFVYRKHRIDKNNCESWLCVNEKKDSCRGVLKTKGGLVQTATTHTCKNDIACAEVTKQVSSARKRARCDKVS